MNCGIVWWVLVSSLCALLVSPMALRLVLVDQNPFQPCFQPFSLSSHFTQRCSVCIDSGWLFHITGQEGHGGRVVTLSPPIYEAGVHFPTRPQVGKLVVACRWSAVYSTEPWRTVCTGFLCPSNYPSWYDLYSVESDVKPRINKHNRPKLKWLNRIIGYHHSLFWWMLK